MYVFYLFNFDSYVDIFFFNILHVPGMVVYVFAPSMWEAEESRYMSLQGQSGLHNKFQAIQGYIEKNCLKK